MQMIIDIICIQDIMTPSDKEIGIICHEDKTLLRLRHQLIAATQCFTVGTTVG
jgi:hypothetical protein